MALKEIGLQLVINGVGDFKAGLELANGAADKAQKDFNENFGKITKTVGVGLTTIGAAITGLAALSVKAAQDEQIGINALDGALKRVNTSYDEQKDAIEGVIAAQEKKTNFSDSAQREALQKLLTVTGSYEASIKALPTVLDVAAGAHMDLESAALLVGRALTGSTETLGRYGIQIDKTAGPLEVLTALNKQFAGSAEAAADPMIVLKNQISNLQESIGQALIPTLTSLLGFLSKVTAGLQEFTAAHPQLTKVIIITVAALGALAAVLGPILILLPTMVAGFAALSAAASFFGVTLLGLGVASGGILIALAAITAGVILLYKNWDTIWPKLKSVAEAAINGIITALNILTFEARNTLALLLEAVNKVIGITPGLSRFKDEINTAIGALKSGIPQVQFATESNQILGEAVTKAGNSMTVAAGGADTYSSSLGILNNVALDTTKIFGPVETTYDKVYASIVKNNQALADQAAMLDEVNVLARANALTQAEQSGDAGLQRITLINGLNDATKRLIELQREADNPANVEARLAAEKGIASTLGEIGSLKSRIASIDKSADDQEKTSSEDRAKASKLAADNDQSRLRFNYDAVTALLAVDKARKDAMEEQNQELRKQSSEYIRQLETVKELQYAQVQGIFDSAGNQRLSQAQIEQLANAAAAANRGGAEANAAFIASLSQNPLFAPGKANGGVAIGGPTWVGERGPELANIPAGSTITPAGNSTTNINVSANYANPQTPQGIRLDMEAIRMAAKF